MTPIESKKAAKQAKPKWFSAAYFTLAALFCAYELATGATHLSAYVIAPIFFTLLSLILFLLPLALLVHFTGLAKGLMHDPRVGEEKIRDAYVTFALILFTATLLLFMYFSLDAEGRQDMASPLSAALFGISIVQVVISSFPEKRAKKTGEFLRQWAKKAFAFGTAPGLVAFFAYVLGAFLFVFLVGTGDLEVNIMRFAFYSLAFILIIRELKIRFWNGKYGKAGIGVPEIALALALAAIIHMPVTWLSEGLEKIQIELMIFAFTYALLAAIEIMGGGEIQEKDNTFLNGL